MPPTKTLPSYDRLLTAPTSRGLRENTVDFGFVGTLQNVKYGYRPDITDRFLKKCDLGRTISR